MRLCGENTRLWPLVEIFNKETLKSDLMVTESEDGYTLEPQKRANGSCVAIVNRLHVTIY